MPYKNLEHDGDEDFLEDEFPTREINNRLRAEEEALLNSEEYKEKEKRKLQDQWLHPDNPFLWDGEI